MAKIPTEVILGRARIVQSIGSENFALAICLELLKAERRGGDSVMNRVGSTGKLDLGDALAYIEERDDLIKEMEAKYGG